MIMMTPFRLWSTALSLWTCEIVMMSMVQMFRIMMNISKTCKIYTNCNYVYNLLGYFVSCIGIICFLFITNRYLNVIMY
jgi:hypothetical protein